MSTRQRRPVGGSPRTFYLKEAGVDPMATSAGRSPHRRRCVRPERRAGGPPLADESDGKAPKPDGYHGNLIPLSIDSETLYLR